MFYDVIDKVINIIICIITFLDARKTTRMRGDIRIVKIDGTTIGYQALLSTRQEVVQALNTVTKNT
jgi:hypothetical protein